MKAVVIVQNSRLSPHPEAGWGALSPLVDRPFLQHVVETVVGQGIRDVQFMLSDEDRVTAKMLGNGTRWGARFRYCASTGPVSIYDAFRQLPQNTDERVLLAHSDRLPHLRLDRKAPATTLFCWREKKLHWTGWGVIRPSDVLLAPRGLDEHRLMEFFLESGKGVICLEGRRPLMARTYEDLLESNRRVLSKEFPGLLLGGKEVEPGVWMARNVRVHPTAWFSPPAFLGENCRIGAMVQVGPSASIGKDCLIERETQVADSVICRGSYVGQRLALRGVVVDRSRLVSTVCDAEIEGVDELLLGSVFGVPFATSVRRLCSRILVAMALIVASPLLAAMLLGSAFGLIPAARKRLVVLAPAVSEPYRWTTFALWCFGKQCVPAGRNGWLRHFFFCFLPALIPVAAGQMDITGPRPRTANELEDLPAGKRYVYLRSRCGIIQPWYSHPSEPDGDVAGFEMTGAGWREATTMIAEYASRVLRSCLPGMPSYAQRGKAE